MSRGGPIAHAPTLARLGALSQNGSSCVGYQERTILVTRAGVVHWDVTIDGSGFMTTSDGVRLDGGA